MTIPKKEPLLGPPDGMPEADPYASSLDTFSLVTANTQTETFRYIDPVERGRAALTGRMFQSLGNPAFRMFMAAMMGQMGAMNMQMVARAWFMYELTNSAVLLGAVSLANGLPLLILSLYGGVIADRIPKKKVLILGQVSSAALALVVALMITTNLVNWEWLLAASVVQGMIMALMMPSRQALISELVGEEGLTNAVALNTAGMNLNRLMAPGVAGLLIAIVGIEAVYYVMAGLYVVATAFAYSLPITGSAAITGGKALDNVADGLRYIKESPVLPALLLATLISVIFSMPYMMLLPIFTKDVIPLTAADVAWMTRLPLLGGLLEPLPGLFVQSSFRLGLLMTVSGIGALAGSLAIAAMPANQRGKLFLGSLLLTAVTLLLFSVSSWYFVSLIIVIPLGLGQAGRMALSNALVQANADDIHRGRVMSVYMMEFGLTNLGIFFIAILAGFIGVQWAIGGSSAILLFVVLYYILRVPSIRQLP